MRVINFTKDTEIAKDAVLADSFYSRMRGLLGKDGLKNGEGLVITRCNSIHMFFMKFAIDVIFVSADNLIVGLVKNIHPFQLSRIYFGASYAVEVPPGTIEKSRCEIKDRVQCQEK